MSRLLAIVLFYFYVSPTEMSDSAKVTNKNHVFCYDCKVGDFENCPAPSFGRCPPVPGPRSCQDTRSVCHHISTWDVSKGSPIGLKKTCGLEGKDDCNSTLCSCVCLQKQYTGLVTKQSVSRPADHSQTNTVPQPIQRKKVSIQFQDRYKSYLALKPPHDITDVLHLSFDMRPTSSKGLIAHFRIGKAYVSLLIGKSRLVLSFDLGSGPATIRSKTKLRTDGKWYSVTAIRKGKKGTLTVGGTKTEGYSGGSKTRFTDSGESGKFQLLIGGGPNPVKPSSTLTGFSGCLKKLRVNNRPFEEMATQLLGGRSVSKCGKPHPCDSFRDNCGVGGTCVVEYPQTYSRPYCLCARGFISRGSSCRPVRDVCKKGYYKCYNGGTCVYDGKSVRCKCSLKFAGRQCKVKSQDMCKQKENKRPLHPCAKTEYCQYLPKTRKFQCRCPIGRLGKTCSEVLKSGYTARFHGYSYAEYKPYFPSNTHLKIDLRIYSGRRDALLLYVPPSKTNRQFLAVGIRNTLVDFRVGAGSHPLIFRTKQGINPNQWSGISITWSGVQVTIVINDKQKRVFRHHLLRNWKLRVSGKSIFVGGIPVKKYVSYPQEYKTILNGLYPYGVLGCISSLKMSNRKVDLFKSAVGGTEVGHCPTVLY